MQCERCSHLLASANHLIFFVRSSFDVRLALKPEMEHVAGTVTTQLGAIHCQNCFAPLGMKSPDQPTLWCIGTGNVILFGRKLTNYQKWRDFFTRYPYSSIEVCPTQIGADNNINENFNLLYSNVDSTRLSFADPSNIEHFLCKKLLASKKRIREYQLLGFIQALLTNTIIVLPTGSGKTLIAALIVARMKKFYPKLMILFIVERVHLVFQQGRYLEHATHLKFCCLSAENITEKEENRINEGHYDVLVVTAGCILDMQISLDTFSCIIFDECHHATGNHPYSQVLRQLRALQNPTQRIVGLTASPVPVRSSIDQTVTSLEKLSARLFNASYFTYSGHTCGHRAELILIVIRQDLVIQRSIDIIRMEMNNLVLQLSELYPSRVIEIDNWENVPAMAKLRGILFNSTWNQGEAKKLVDQLLKKCNELEKINLLGINNIGETDHRPSPRMYELLCILRAREYQNSKIIVFVSTRKAAEIVTTYLEQIPEIKEKFNPLKIVGQAGAFGISLEEGQKKAILMFYGKTCNLLVSTGVLEEGTNIPACDIVIRFDKLTTSLISYVQARGRARKENSKYILIMNADDAKTQEKLERDENQIEKALEKLNNTDSAIQLSREIHTILERTRSHFNPNHPSDKSIDYTPATGSDCSIELYIETGEDTHKKDILKNSIDSAFSDLLNIATDSMEVIPQEYVPTLGIFLNTDKLVFLSLDSDDVSYDYYSICVKWDFCLKSIQHLETEEKSQMVWSKINVSILPEVGVQNSHSMVEWNYVKCLLIGHFEHRNKFVYNYKRINTIHKIRFHNKDYLTIECESDRIEIPITELYKFVVASWSENEVTLYLPLASTPHVYDAKNKRTYATSLLSALSLNPVLGLTLEYDKSNWFDLWALIHHCELFPVPLFDTRIHMQLTNKPFDAATLYHPLVFSNKLIRDCFWAFSVLCSSRSVCFPQYAKEDIYQLILSKANDHRIIQLFAIVLNSISDRLIDIKTISDHGNNESGHLLKKKHLISYWNDITEHINEAYYSIVVNNNVYPVDNKLDLNHFKLDCAVITQSSIICLPPIICHSSRLLRNYSDLRIISVAFRDEQYQKLHGADCIGHIGSILKNGFILHGSRYSFLACSNSQLRDHKALFVTFPNPDDTQAKIQLIRNSILGNTKIGDEAKYMSRLGLFCTSDYPTVKINKAKVLQIDDIPANNDVLVTDGAGKIDRELAYTVNGILLDSNCRFQRFFEEGINYPAAYQIRLAGYKGVLVVVDKENDPDFRTNPNASILVRPSMYKFNWTNSTLGIIKTTKFNRVNLNRDVITLLTSLIDNTGRWNPSEVLRDLMRQELKKFADILHDEQKAFKAIAHNLPNFFKSKSQRLNLYFKQVGARFNVLCEPFLFSLLRLIYTYNIKSLTSKTYIPIEDGALLMGVPDPIGVLQDNQVFVRYKTNKASSELTILHGPVLVYRNPCMHPGDLLRLTAVDYPLLHNLINVIVFPIKGAKSLPGSTGGGDLDGDEFSVIWDKRLIPPRHCVVNSLNYDDVARYAKKKYRPHSPGIAISADTNEKIKERLAEFYCRVVENDSIGRVANLHLLVSDHLKKGALDLIAIKLAKSQCIAVDFPKTGIPPEVPLEALKIKKTFGYPDFMEKKREASYKSKKPLGELYRMCQSMCYDAFTANNSNSGNNTLQQLTNAYAVSLKVDGSDLYMDKARNIYYYYCNEFSKILTSFGIESEQEAMLKLFINWHPMMDSRKYKVTGILDVEITQLFEKVRLMLVNQLSATSMSEKLRLASACYQVAYGEHHNSSNLQFLSFPWILGDLLCSIPKQPLNLSDSNYESIGVSANAYLIKLKNHIQCTVNLKMSAYSVLEATINEKSTGAFTTSTFGIVSHYLCDPDSILEISITPTRMAFSRPFVPPTMNISQFRSLPISQQNAYFLNNVISNYIDKVALSLEYTSGVPLIHCTIESPIQSGIEIKVDIAVNSIGVQMAKHIQNLYKISGGVVFAWLWLLVHWARQCRIIKWDVIENESEWKCILSTDEFIAFALYIFGKMPSHCRHFNGSSRICTLSEILDSITPETNKCTLGRLLVHFFIQGTKIAFEGRAITYEWPIVGNPRSCTIGEQALAELSKLLFQAQQSLTYSRDIEKFFGSLNNPTPYSKVLPPVLTARLEGAMQFHSTRLEHLSGAKVNMRMKGRLIQVNGHGSPFAIQKLNIEVEKLVYMSQFFKRPKMNASKYQMPDGLLMWMVNGDTTSRVGLSLDQIDCFHLLHEASERNRIILTNHELNPNWLAHAKENIQNVVIRQLTSFITDKYECLNSLRFLARFGNFYLVNSHRDFHNIGGSVSLSDLENKLRNKKIYHAATAITGKFGEPDGNSNVLRTVPLPVMRTNPHRSRIESSSKNRYLHRTFCPSVIPVTSASDNRASTIYNSVLIGCGFTPVRRPSGSYKWKLCIAASNDCEVQMFLNSHGDILKIIERPIAWLHATLIADRRDFTQIDRNRSQFLNDVRFKMEAADVVLPGSQLDQVLFPDSNRVRPLISHRTPKVISRFKEAVLILKRYTSKNFYKNGSIYARISTGIDYTGVDLCLHRTFCELALYFSEDELRSALNDGNNTSKIQSIVDDAINISMEVSNRIAIYYSAF